MKKSLILSLILASSGAYAAEINPFMSAQDREEALTKERQAEETKLKAMVAEAVKELKNANKTLTESQEAAAPGRSGGPGAETVQTEAEPEKPAPTEPSDFAIAAIKGPHILIRQLDNKSMIVGTGRKFWDNGEAYVAKVTDHETVKITRVSDDKVVFFGGVGSVFTPMSSDTSGTTGDGGNEL